MIFDIGTTPCDASDHLKVYTFYSNLFLPLSLLSSILNKL